MALARSCAERIRMAACLLVPAVALGAVLRVVLYVRFREGGFRPLELALALGAGVLFDLLTLNLALAPAWLVLAGLRCRFLGFAVVRVPLLTLALGAMAFALATECFFFEEFNARFNHIALDYLIYPKEVFVNIWDSYNVPLVMASAAALGVLLSLPVARLTRGMTFEPCPAGLRWRALAAVLVVETTCGAALAVLPAAVSTDRIVAEIAQNGLAQPWRAFWTAHLDYEPYYRALPWDQARRLAARTLGFPEPSAEALARPLGQFALQRKLASAAPDLGHDVVVILEESLGSEFIGVLGHPERRTSPGFDRWSEQGILLTNLVATGNRTVRGIEGTLCSFVPLPGDSVVKRTHFASVATLAQVWKARGARTAFFYGGFGMFDHMKPFARATGWDQFVEQTDFPAEAFRTIWGVADEFVLGALLEAQVAAKQKGEHYFFTALTVSNHKPYRIPKDRITPLTSRPSRENAVAYSDWALADYLTKARTAGLLDSTVVLVAGDHGARVYGSEEIPAASYRIPALLLHPDPRWRGVRLDRLCSQIDLGPTLLSLAGVTVTAPFLGQDLTHLPAEGGRAFLNHNRDLGLLTDQALVVLGLRKKVYYYRRSDRGSDAFRLLGSEEVTPDLVQLADAAAGVFQTAYELFESQQYRMP